MARYLSRLFQLNMKMTIKKWTLNIFNTSAFPAPLLGFFLSVLYAYMLLNLACLCKLKLGGWTGLFSSKIKILCSYQNYRPCSALVPTLKIHNKVSYPHPNWFSNCQSETRRRFKPLKGSNRNEDGPIFFKTSAPYSLMTTYRMNLN